MIETREKRLCRAHSAHRCAAGQRCARRAGRAPPGRRRAHQRRGEPPRTWPRWVRRSSARSGSASPTSKWRWLSQPENAETAALRDKLKLIKGVLYWDHARCLSGAAVPAAPRTAEPGQAARREPDAAGCAWRRRAARRPPPRVISRSAWPRCRRAWRRCARKLDAAAGCTGARCWPASPWTNWKRSSSASPTTKCRRASRWPPSTTALQG